MCRAVKIEGDAMSVAFPRSIRALPSSSPLVAFLQRLTYCSGTKEYRDLIRMDCNTVMELLVRFRQPLTRKR